MSTPSIESFAIKGLHGTRRSVVLKIEDDRLVMVGENGSGKTTVLNMLFYFLTLQWTRLADLSFQELTVTISGKSVTVSCEEVRAMKATPRFAGDHGIANRWWRMTSPPTRRRVERALEMYGSLDAPEARGMLFSLAEELGVNPMVLMEYATFRPGAQSERELKRQAEAAQAKQDRVSELTKGMRVLYLPTYRRIEQDLKSIFPGEQGDRMREGIRRRTGERFTELVEFGMQDVEKAIQSRMSAVKELIRGELSGLTGRYLSDIIRRRYLQRSDEEIAALTTGNIDPIIDRIDEHVLPAEDKTALHTLMAEIRASGTVSEKDAVAAHFLVRLLSVHQRTLAAQEDVRAFVKVCNEYLIDKQLVYDDVEFTVLVRSLRPETEGPLQFSVLSSGEKQIVSLFAHLHLSSPDTRFFVVIDEPELSLSVPWQSRFLPTIWQSGRVSGLIAVTHSPFTYDNEFRKYAKSFGDFESPLTAGA